VPLVSSWPDRPHQPKVAEGEFVEFENEVVGTGEFVTVVNRQNTLRGELSDYSAFDHAEA
jgi:hypothetical protein